MFVNLILHHKHLGWWELGDLLSAPRSVHADNHSCFQQAPGAESQIFTVAREEYVENICASKLPKLQHAKMRMSRVKDR